MIKDITFVIPLDDNVPSYQANSKQGKYGRYRTKKLVDFQAFIKLHVKSLINKNGYNDTFPLKCDVHMDIDIYPKNRKHGDRTNMLKGIEDALEGVLFVNDKQVKGGEVNVHEPSDFPSLHIAIRLNDN